jgi:hypothetical protein
MGGVVIVVVELLVLFVVTGSLADVAVTRFVTVPETDSTRMLIVKKENEPMALGPLVGVRSCTVQVTVPVLPAGGTVQSGGELNPGNPKSGSSVDRKRVPGGVVHVYVTSVAVAGPAQLTLME